jgi:hypothetical protein
MPRYRVYVREVHIQPYVVEASSPLEAIENCFEGDLEDGLEYSHTLEQETFTVDRLLGGEREPIEAHYTVEELNEMRRIADAKEG